MERDFAANGAEAARLLHLLHEVGLKGQKLAVSHVTKKAAQEWGFAKFVPEQEIQWLEMISERARLGKRLIELEKDIELRERRSTGLLKAQLLADDVAHQLRAASKDHAKAVALVSKQLNATDDRLQRLRGRVRLFSAAFQRLKGCLNPEEKLRRQPFFQELQEASWRESS
eukprot:g29101.t1